MSTHRSKLLALLIALTVVLGGLTAGPALALTAPTTTPTAPTAPTLPSSLGGFIGLSDVVVTGTPATGLQASATMTVGASAKTVAVAVQYTDSKNWSISVEKDSAGDSASGGKSLRTPTPPGWVSGTTVDLNDLSGTITSTNGSMAVNLTLGGQVVGDAKFSMIVAIDHTGYTANALVEDVTIGSLVLNSASIMMSTQSKAASITAELSTEAGTFDASLSVNEVESGSYHVNLSVSGAELAGESPEFKLISLGFSTDITTKKSSCTTVDVDLTGSVEVEGITYTLDEGRLIFCGEDVTTFEMKITVSHTAVSTDVSATASGQLTIAWTDTPGSLTTAGGSTITYASGYFGQVILSETRGFSEKLDGKTFSKTVKISIGFGIAVFQPDVDDAYTFDLGIGGSVEADRVSGDLGCAWIDASNDFVCSVRLRLNPSWAGIYHHDWTNL